MIEHEIHQAERMIGDVAVVDVAPEATSLPAIVMVHGGCHGAWCWEPMQRLFAADGWRSVALDWFNHGRSALLQDDEWLTRDIVAVRAEVGAVCASVEAETGRPPILMGHSMGGLATLAHLTSDLRSASAAVLLAPVVPKGYAASAIDMPLELSEPWMPPPLEMARQLFFSGASDSDAEDFHARLRPESPAAVWQATRWTAELPLDTLEGLPILAFGAEHDLLVPAEAVENLARAIGARYEYLPGVGHGLTLDPIRRQVAETTMAWLRDPARLLVD